MSPDILRKLSEADLQAIAAGDVTRVSTQGLQLISGSKPKAEKPIDPTEGMSGTQKVLANIGAGMADLGMGARQLWTDMTGTPEQQAALKAEVDEKKKRDKMLAESTTGGSLLQIAGNVAPTLAIPVGSAVRGINMAARGAMALPRALGLAARAAPAAAAPARLGTAALAADSALTGGALAAIDPVGTDESRGINMLSGATLSAATPLAIAGGNQVRRMVTQSGGGERAAEQIAAELGANSPQMLRQTIANLRNVQQGPIPLSTAASLADPQLARLEAGSRARNGANWYDFDQNQARSVWNELSSATRGADDVGARRAMRSSNRDTLYNQAMSTVNEPAFARDLTGFRANLDTAARSAEASNPAVRSMLQSLADEIDRLGPDFRPEHLATIRANLASKSPLVPTNAYQAAPRESPATMSVLREVDNILNNATGGRWQDVLGGYARDSNLVRSSQAAGKVREAFIDPATGRVRGVSADVAGDVPKVTEAGLGRALDVARGPRKETVLDPTVNARLEGILEALRSQNIVQGVKRSATAGGGSNTASDTMASRAAGGLADAVANTAGTPGRAALDALRNFGNTRKDAALAEALQNPQRMVQLLEDKLRSGRPLSATEQQLLALLRAPAAAE